MKKFKVLSIVMMSTVLVFSCKDQLDVKNPNLPTANSIDTENNITALGLGVYYNGFGLNAVKYIGFQGRFPNDVLAYHEAMGDVIGVEAANVYINQLGMPDLVTLDNGTPVPNPATPNTQLGLLRFANQNSLADANPVYYEWAYMYNINNLCNSILRSVDGITYTGDPDSKKNTLKAWAYWWKGYAYARIGSMYYAGIINNDVGAIVHDYVSHDAVIAESSANFDNAIAALSAVTDGASYTALMTKLIPSISQVGKGQIPTVPMFIRNINTMKARNLLVNTRVSAMTPTKWADLLTLANAGLTSTDNIFTGRSNATGDFMSSTIGTVALVAAADPSTATYKVSERLIQDYKAGDRRLANNFRTPVTGGVWIGNSDRGNAFNTRYKLVDFNPDITPTPAAPIAGVVIYANRKDGQGEFFMAGTYEENELMKAEAKLYTGDLSGAVTSIDLVRNYQGAGLAATPVGTLAEVKEELRKERRVGLAFRALSFYDARRWGVIDPVSAGGGRTGAVVISKAGVTNTNATINYNFLDYWDVPDNELVFNTPSASSAPVKNPRSN